MDPEILQKGWSAGMLKNFASLKKAGSFAKLETTIPPQSPVAWASFIAGATPGKTGVYDFIKRDPSNYEPSLVFSSKEPLIRAPKFWDILSKNSIPSTILFLPDTYPPSNLKGSMLSGMGVPDITGTEGTFTLFTTKSYPTDEITWRGRVVNIDDEVEVTSSLPGPKYTFLNETKTSELPIQIVKKGNDAITLKVGKETITLNKGNFSKWIKLSFSIDYFTKIHGIAQFYLKSTNPLEVYMSPINFDPDKPVYQIGFPKQYPSSISKDNGLYSTLGLPQDTWALEEDILDENAFLKQMDSVLTERTKIYLNELDKQKGGVLVSYFGMTDTASHMFWRFLDQPKSIYKNTILDYYQKMDDILGMTLKKLKKDDVVIVVSDHGFSSFDYEFNVNSWLKNKGYLALKNGKSVGSELLSDIDWSKTKAYAIGYNGIYINMASRESKGIVNQSNSTSLKNEIKNKLLAEVNPKTKLKFVKNVYDRDDLGISIEDENSPDLFIGYYKSTRSSWETAVGAVPKDVITKREGKWSGDHLFDPSEVPGIFLSNLKISNSNPNLIDIIPSVLNLYKITKDPSMEGDNIF